jgi:GDPmannose 4,6-dehydratase
VQIFGNNKSNFYNENSKISPTTPYAVSKASGYWLTKIFRENYNLYSCSGILFNHESVLRDDRFVSKKIINFTKKYKKNNKIKLRMGNLDIYRDWGWAPEYVEAMWLMLQQKKPIDLIIGTGKKHSLREFVNVVFKKMKINKKNLVERSSKLIRKIDINSYRANTNLCKKTIKWEAKISFKEIIYKMLKEEIY